MAGTGEITRRAALKTITIACCGAFACTLVGAAQADQAKRIDQITDINASAAGRMFRFEPNLLVVEPGEEIAVLNSRGQHTVHSVPQLWPASVPPVAISNQPEAIVRFDEEGFYAFRCRRHGMYGMVMLVVCGGAGDVEHARQSVDEMKALAREKQAFKDLISEYEKTLS